MTATSTTAAAGSSSSRLVAAVALSMVTYFGARIVLELDTIATWQRVAAAIAPVPFFVWALFELARGARQLDEMQRRMHLEALAIAYPLTVVLLMTLGLLELAVPLNKNDWSYRHVWQMQAIIYLAGLTLTYRRYGVSGK
jgi:hypothetical protein